MKPFFRHPLPKMSRSSSTYGTDSGFPKRFEKTKSSCRHIHLFLSHACPSSWGTDCKERLKRCLLWAKISMWTIPEPRTSCHLVAECQSSRCQICTSDFPAGHILVRHGDRYGLRSDNMNASEVHSKHRPETPFLLGKTKKLYSLGPLPFPTTKAAVTKLMNAWKWEGPQPGWQRC